MSTLQERIKEAMADAGCNGTDLWRACGLTSGAVSQWINGPTKTIKGENLLKVSRFLKVRPEWLASGAGKKNLSLDGPNATITIGVPIPLMNAAGSMGAGNDLPDNEVVIDSLRISKAWVESNLSQISSVSNLAFIHAIGDSMTPTFNDGDILLVDTGNNSVTADKIYVLSAHGRLFIKRVRQRIDGTYEVSSDNPAVRTTDILNGDHEIEVKGRVVWVWNGKRI